MPIPLNYMQLMTQRLKRPSPTLHPMINASVTYGSGSWTQCKPEIVARRRCLGAIPNHA